MVTRSLAAMAIYVFCFLYTMLFPREGGKNLMLVFVGEVKPYDPATSLAIMKNNNDLNDDQD